ncbi:DUF2087 domain-containing protein [Robertmurraya yapensis]|uniref:DUF2087 domain-containing protein n=2 Tax=Bacillaceae TaxID=186817 RepID=A0A431WK92_9BACI|nr:DUF2087 domain-containing protein [Bacillus yapensis]RTR35842.1 DUF2087 domain-containing protein [Bacillus yapensis]TKS98644.1 DUF2087 domain-containing protein [Bacillus yapensis]
MDVSELFWNASLEELKRGYIEEKNAYTCLLCGEKIDKGVIYPYNDVLYEAERFIRIHIELSHESVFEYLLRMDKKLTGLTDHQKGLLDLFYQGKTDTEVQTELGIGSTSTIRHHRFALKEKERQAKTFLALMELLKEKDEYAPAFIPVHKTAKMVDERYNVTEEEQLKIIKKFFSNGKLMKFPPKEKQRLVALQEIAKQLKVDYVYNENELNQSLKDFYEDYVLIRRYLIEYGFLDRKPDGSQYWLIK